MPPTQVSTNGRIDPMMERASEALVRGEYFECERLSAEALRRAVAAGDFERAARIALPLLESRRMIRDMAFDTRAVFVIDDELPKGRDIRPGMYLVCPPRVGVEGRMLRDDALANDVPVIVVVREPTTRDGLWPVVAVGPVTVRCKVEPPTPPKSRAGRSKATAAPPPPEWFISTNERLGDVAIASVPAGSTGVSRAMALYDRLCAMPDHEKLHQRFAEAAQAAAKKPRTGAGRPHGHGAAEGLLSGE